MERKKQLTKIIDLQNEMIEILKENLESRDKFINILERQLKVAENHIKTLHGQK